MTQYEALTLLVAILAIIVSVVSLVRTRRIQDKQMEFQKLAATLSSKQLEIIEKENAARINVRLERDRGGEHFSIVNEGKAVARDIHIALDGTSNDNPFIVNDYTEKIPIKSLHPGNSVRVLAGLDMQSARQYTILVRWTNPDGRQVSDEVLVSI